MSAAAIAASAAAGLVVAPLIAAAVERVPAKRPVLARPLPEAAETFRTPRGVVLVAVTIALFAATAIRLGATWELPAFLLLAGALLALSLIDLRHFLLPNRIVFPVTLASIALLVVAGSADGNFHPLLRGLACGVATFAAFTVLHLLSPRALGFGDVKLSFLLGVDLGWCSASCTAPSSGSRCWSPGSRAARTTCRSGRSSPRER